MDKYVYLTHRLGPNRYYHSGQSELGSKGNEKVPYIPQSSKTEASAFDGLVSYPGLS